MPKLITKSKILTLLSSVLFVLGFLNFHHPDLTGTILFSQNLNIENFYSNCHGNCTYFPLTYFIFYVWSLLGKFLFHPNLNDPTALIIGLEVEPEFFLFNKLLIVILFIGSVIILDKIAKKLIQDKEGMSSQLFLYSPFSFFVIFMFAGYDIFIVFLCLFAIHHFIKNNLKICFLILSISLSFKFFSILFALSLLALIRVKFLYKIFYALVLISIPLIQFIIFKQDPAFLDSVLALIYRNSANTHVSFNPSYIVTLLFTLWLLSLQFSIRFKNLFLSQNFIYLPYISFLFLMLFTPMQPQWIILVLPFLYMIINHSNLVKQFLFVQLIYFVLFIVSITNIWAGNVDLNLSDVSLFEVMRDNPYQYKDFFLDLHNNKLFFALFYGLFYSFFLLPILPLLKNISLFKGEKVVSLSLIKLLFIIGCLLLLYPYILSPFMSKDKFSMANELNRAKKITPLNLRNTTTYDLKENLMVCEIFSPSYPSLTFIELRLKVLGEGGLKDFNFYIDGQIIKKNKIINDNKSVFMELPSIDNKSNTKEFCIKNESTKPKQLRINKINYHLQNYSNKLIFSHGAFGLSLLHKKNEN